MKKIEQEINLIEILNNVIKQGEDDIKIISGKVDAYKEIANYISSNNLKITQTINNNEIQTVEKSE
jgi:hypothetical protein